MNMTGLERSGDRVQSLSCVPQTPPPNDGLGLAKAGEREPHRARREVGRENEILVRQRSTLREDSQNTLR